MLVQPSSLIFLVIIGIWAAYFVQYWVRRREHLATIRSVDAFSDTMRVLQRRAALPSVDTGGHAPRTYAVSPARAMRPQVTVKRAESHLPQRDPRAAVASDAAPSAAPRQAAPFVDAHEPHVATMRPSRTTRGVVLTVGVLGTVTFGALAALGILVAWSPAVPFVMAVAGFAWLRAGVQGEIRAKRAAQRRTHRPAARGGRAAGAQASLATTGQASPAVTGHEVTGHEVEHQVALGVEPEVAEVSSAAPFDVSEDPTTVSAEVPATGSDEPHVEREDAVASADEPAATVMEHEIGLPEVDEDDIPLTWDPRPVPRPTYTMKARAAERPAPAAEVEPAAEAELTAYDDDLLERRIVGG